MKSTSLLLSFVVFAALVPAVYSQLSNDASYVITLDDSLRTYDANGSLLDEIDIPYPTGDHPQTETVRDLVHMPDGNVAVYNGSFDPYLSIYDTQASS